MRETVPDRAVVLGEYILDTGATVRATAKVFKISKSTVHTESDETERFEWLVYKPSKTAYLKTQQHGLNRAVFCVTKRILYIR